MSEALRIFLAVLAGFTGGVVEPPPLNTEAVIEHRHEATETTPAVDVWYCATRRDDPLDPTDQNQNAGIVWSYSGFWAPWLDELGCVPAIEWENTR